MRKVVAILEVDDDKLSKLNSDFPNEMGWVADSGIYLIDYINVDE